MYREREDCNHICVCLHLCANTSICVYKSQVALKVVVQMVRRVTSELTGWDIYQKKTSGKTAVAGYIILPCINTL